MSMNVTIETMKEKEQNFALKEKEEGKYVILLTINNQKTCSASTWFLDIGSSNHMCKRKDFFT